METWNDFLDGLYERKNHNDLTEDGIEIIDFVKDLNVPFGLNIHKCLTNFDVVNNYSLLDYRPSDYGTKSMYRYLTDKRLRTLPDFYSNWFYASFPEIYIWATPGCDSRLETLELLETIIKQPDKFLTTRKTFNVEACMLLCKEYKKQNNDFETE